MNRMLNKSNPDKGYFKMKRLSLLIAASTFAALDSTYAGTNEEIQFNSSFLRSDVDVSQFSRGNPVKPGTYIVELHVNDRWKGRYSVDFISTKDDDRVAKPCLDSNLAAAIGIDVQKLDQSVANRFSNKEKCILFEELSPSIKVNYVSSSQKLEITSPQIFLLRNARGYVSPELWDNGITALTTQYDYNAWRTDNKGSSSYSTQYLSLKNGINWDVWRLRQRGSFTWNNNNGWNYDNANIYLERSIQPIKSRLVVGESVTDGQVFDSIGFRGALLSSDDRMYEDSRRGYAPVVTGVANSNALVRISQKGVRIYETTVPPGPFSINDLYPTGSGGDLLVTIQEADGSEKSFTVTYASLTELLRPGTTRYTLMGGKYHNNNLSEKPEIVMGSLRHGFTNLLTGYSGVIGSDEYQSIAGGIALNTSIGAISSDITHAKSKLKDGISKEGQSIRFSFSKILPLTDTNITLASYRYSSSGYYTIDDAMMIRSSQWSSHDWFTNSVNRKNKIQLSASQQISDTFGYLNISASTQDYWNRDGRDTEYQVGYTNSFKYFNLNVNASRTRDLENGKWDDKIAIGVSLPLGDTAHSLYLNSTYVQGKDYYGLQNSVTGTAGENRQINYNAYTSYDKYKHSKSDVSGGVSGNWTSPWATIGGNISTSRNYNQYGLNLSGGILGYNSGLIFTPIMGDTMAIVEADNAAGAKIVNNTSLKLDSSGRTAVPYLTPYRQNSIEIDPKGLSNDVSLEETSKHSVPTAGAVVLMKYKTETGYSLLVNLAKSNFDIPFGASLTDENGKTVGYVAQGGQSFVRVQKTSGKLTINWGDKVKKQCQFEYVLPENISDSHLRQIDAVCK
ncbi:fimbria/pilus outer membrane usher protein [Enterobacter hormaechei]|uniref:fimbria/pilus outer membrane usher protein n=1 Tax=Enterobacter hormaechei TaxID=158836 RepID=UPI00217601F0|nr:fimbria/pilus outer membrane usher protein [Enterobacter hormaechei]UVZ93286.1 fimbrial biogenesis outer membrane usher protein [Enterobacter hormaechei]